MSVSQYLLNFVLLLYTWESIFSSLDDDNINRTHQCVIKC